jgi:hypothetical protein
MDELIYTRQYTNLQFSMIVFDEGMDYAYTYITFSCTKGLCLHRFDTIIVESVFQIMSNLSLIGHVNYSR